jgi:hypothetical protein
MMIVRLSERSTTRLCKYSIDLDAVANSVVDYVKMGIKSHQLLLQPTFLFACYRLCLRVGVIRHFDEHFFEGGHAHP